MGARLPDLTMVSAAVLSACGMFRYVHMRAWADAMASAWTVRNGGGGPEGEQFVRRSDIDRETETAVVRVLGQAFGGGEPGSSNLGIPSVQRVIEDVLSSKVVEYLRTPLEQIALPTGKLNALIARLRKEQGLREDGDALLDSRIDVVELSVGDASALIATEASARIAGDTANASLITALDTRVGSSEAAILGELSVRSNKDNSLAQAINTMWASIGGAAALIQDGALAAVSPAAVAATKWLQVQAAVTDPNTGLVNAVSIKQELNAYASAANNTFNASYGLRLNVNGAISGFSLLASAGAGSAPGAASSTFAILADRLALISPTNASVLPFTVDGSGNAVFAGIIYAAGGVFGGQVLVGASPAISGTSMTGSGAVINSNGTFAIGNAGGNISYNNVTLSLNGQVVGTANLINNAVTNALTGSVAGVARNNTPGFGKTTSVTIGSITTSAQGSGRVTIQLSPATWTSVPQWQFFNYMIANVAMSGTFDTQSLTFSVKRNGTVIRSQTASGNPGSDDFVRFCAFAIITDVLTPGSTATYTLEMTTTTNVSTNHVHEVIAFDYLITEAKR